MSPRRDALVTALGTAGDPERAAGQQRYMKSAMPFHGVVMGDVRRIARSVVRDHPFRDRADWEAGVLEIWRAATHREQRYAATEMAALRPWRNALDGDALPMIEEMIVTGAWWDHVDALAATHVGCMLSNDPAAIRPVVWNWAVDATGRPGALWRRRTAIICQLKRKDEIDLDLLVHAIDASMDSPEFFLRKAIGWALRQHARLDPGWVRSFVDDRAGRLSPLSVREATKHLL